MMSSEQLERQTERNRAEVESTIDELRARLTPGQLVDEVLSYARDGGRQFTANLGQQNTNNPMPVALIGAGLAWFLFGREATASSTGAYHRGYNGSGLAGMEGKGMGEMTGEAMQKAGDMVGDAVGAMRHTAHDASDALHSAMGGVRHAAESAGASMSNAAQGVGNAASSAYQSTASRVNQTATKIADSAGAFEQKTMAAAREAFVQVKDQPLMLVGFGLALGAAIGAAFPATELENRVMGDTADELKHEAKSLASDQLHQATDAAQHIVEDAVKTVNGSNGAMVDSGEGDSGR